MIVIMVKKMHMIGNLVPRNEVEENVAKCHFLLFSECHNNCLIVKYCKNGSEKSEFKDVTYTMLVISNYTEVTSY